MRQVQVRNCSLSSLISLYIETAVQSTGSNDLAIANLRAGKKGQCIVGYVTIDYCKSRQLRTVHEITATATALIIAG